MQGENVMEATSVFHSFLELDATNKTKSVAHLKTEDIIHCIAGSQTFEGVTMRHRVGDADGVHEGGGGAALAHLQSRHGLLPHHGREHGEALAGGGQQVRTPVRLGGRWAPDQRRTEVRKTCLVELETTSFEALMKT